MSKLYTSPSRSFTPHYVKVLLEHHLKQGAGAVVFMEEMHWLSSARKAWTEDVTAALFWQENVPKNIPGATNWFGYYWKKEYDNDFNLVGSPSLRVFGMETFEPVIDAVYIPSIDTVTYSRFQHDFFYVPGANVAVDGGRAYLRILGDPADYRVVPYNLLTRSFELEDKVYYVE